MILAFSTQLNGKPTYFVEKIQRSISKNLHNPHIDYKSEWFNSFIYFKVKPKHHTIREDKNDRWKVGRKIDFFINARQKNMFQFAPVLPVVSVQEIEIVYIDITRNVLIDNRLYYFGNSNDGCSTVMHLKMLKLAQNDGFDTIEDFFDYFDKDFKGKIIHWTDYKY